MSPALLIVALTAITVSTLIARFVIGYLVRPPGAPRYLLRIPSINPRWVGRRLAEIIYKRKK